MRNKKNVHLICNAHLDPVWLWEWEEGVAEAISTFRTAAEICEENDNFIFNHNEVILYKWVAEYEPELFKRIQKLVKAGKWHIMGGWYLQPDCNMPSGESFVRQILVGKKYFSKNFGQEPTTAINFDPFGHTQGLVQILSKSGYDSYLFLRPMPQIEEFNLEDDDFIWVGYDNSEVLGKRFSHEQMYTSALGKAKEKIQECIEDQKDRKVSIVLWGVGNHGGGPSKKDIKQVNKFIEKDDSYNIIHSTPENYFKELNKYRDELPRHKADLNPWAVGCYTSQILIKQKHRQLENEYYMVEKMVSAASVNGLMEYPSEELEETLEDLLFSEFHDILPGSSIEPVEKMSIRVLDHGLEKVSRIKTKAFLKLASGQNKAKNGEIPILVYNPHPYRITKTIECEFQLEDHNREDYYCMPIVYQGNKKLPVQVEKEESNLPIEWRKKTVFTAELQPNQMNRFDCKFEHLDSKPKPKLKAENGKIKFKTSELEVEINARTGFVDRYSANGVDCLKEKAFVPTVFKDNEDPWGMLVNSFTDVEGRFKLMNQKESAEFSGVKTDKLPAVRVIEDGPVRSVVEAVFKYNNSSICQKYKLPKKGTEIEIETRVIWNEKDKFLKLCVPVKNKDNQLRGQVAYGSAELKPNYHEHVAQKWAAVVNEKNDFALTCINNGTYGVDYTKRGLGLSLLRSPAYSAHPFEGETNLKKGRFLPRSDQGERIFKFWFNAGKIKERMEAIDREATIKNEKPFALSFFPPGMGQKPKPLVKISNDKIQVSTVKKAENTNDIILRLFEPTGRKRNVTVSLPFMKKKFKVTLNAFEIKTIKIDIKKGTHKEVNLLERKK